MESSADNRIILSLNGNNYLADRASLFDRARGSASKACTTTRQTRAWPFFRDYAIVRLFLEPISAS